MRHYFFCLVVTFQSLTAFGAEEKRIEYIQEFRPDHKNVVEIWIPTPMEHSSYQTLISRTFSGNPTVLRVATETGYPAPFIYARWENVAKPELKITNIVAVKDRSNLIVETTSNVAYLEPSKHVQTDGIVRETALKITGTLTDSDAKAKAIYNWIIDNTARDPGVRGCGLGDVKSTLTSGNLRGKCADLNSLFVGLARAAGIPAREVFGQRVASSSISTSLGKEGDNSKAQHCRAEYYSNQKKAWIPVDPADVRKYILEEKLSLTDAKVQAVREKFFGYWEGTWVSFNHARDFKLDGYGTAPVNYFMYPLLVSAKIRPDGVDPKEVGYSYKTTVLDEI